MQSFVQLQLYLIATSTNRAVSTTWNKHHGERYSSLVRSLSTRTTTTSDCSVVWWMVLPFYQYLILPMVFICLEHCPDDPPEAAELLDYFDSTYISGRLRQQNPGQNQAVRLVLTRNPPMFPPAIWNVHDATVNGDARTNNMCEGWNKNQQHVRGLEQQILQPGRTCPSVYMACHRVVSKGRSYCPYYYPARCRW
jgi:hypothetical protein